MGPRFAVATSEHPLAVHAVAECAGSLLEASPVGFENLLCFVGTPFGGALLDITGALAELLGASASVGMESRTLLMGGRMARGTPALVVLAFAAGDASLGYTPGMEPGGAEPGCARSTDGPESPGMPGVRVMFADPFSFPSTMSSPAGQLQHDVSLVGGCLSGDPNGAATRLVHDGIEHRFGTLFVDVAAELASVHLVHGTEAMTEPVVVTSVIDGQLVALDDIPAAELLESRVRSMDLDIVRGIKQVGFTVPGDGRLVAARRSALGLTTSLPLAPGTTVRPAVCSERAVAEQVRAAIKACSGGMVLLFAAEDLTLGFPVDEYPDLADGSQNPVVGPLVSGVLWGHRDRYELVERSVLVVGFDPGPTLPGPVGPRPAGL